MEFGLMVPGHLGISFGDWRSTLRAAEQFGFKTVFHSDHFFTLPPKTSSPDVFIQMTVAAETTETIRFGVMVSPITFRHPVHLARSAAQIDLLSNGRFVLGVGAGWFKPEHDAFGFPFPPVRERFDRLGEALAVIDALWGPEPVTFNGTYYQLADAQIHPRPGVRRPQIAVGGEGERRTLPLVARYADEWNVVNPSLSVYAQKASALDRACEAQGRDPSTIRRSVVLLGLLGPTEAIVAEARRRVTAMFSEYSPSPDLDTSAHFGHSVGEIVETLGRLAELGVHEVDFQVLFPENTEVLEYIAAEIVPQAVGRQRAG